MTGTTAGKPNKHALLIGISKYPMLAARYQLNGCVNDAELIYRILQENFGFPADNMKLLRDAEATRDKVLAALDDLVARVSADDIVVIGYSGHGSRMTDREGDEPDGMDETIVPHDSGRAPNPNRDITDDEIYVRLLALSQKTPNIALIFDCCHSGTITRDLLDDTSGSRWVEPDNRPISELPPSPIANGLLSMGGATRDLGPSGWLPLGKRYVLVAGCFDDESSYEYRIADGGTNIYHGALTYFLAQELVKAQSGATYRDVFEPASVQVSAAFPRQHPQMEGTQDRELFGTRDIKPMSFVPVRARTDNTATLGAGAAHVMTVKSRWAIYPQETKELTEATPRLGLVEITTVRALDSDAQVVEEPQAGAITRGARAVEVAHNYGEMRLVVSIKPDADPTLEAKADELKALIARSDLLRVGEPDEAQGARIYLLDPRQGAGLNDPVPQLGALSDQVWAVVGEDGLLMMPVHLVSEAEAAGIILDNLEKITRYRLALVLKNPNVNSLLKDKVDFTLMQQTTGGDWKPAEPEQAGGQVVYREGDRIAIRIVNRHTGPIYANVLDFGLTWAIAPVYPLAGGAAEQLAPGNAIQVGVRQGEEIELYIPDNFPFVHDTNDPVREEGVETLKLFATTQPADFSSLLQGGVRGLSGLGFKDVASPLEELLALALSGSGTRDSRPTRVPPDAEWTTVERAFVLRRGGL